MSEKCLNKVEVGYNERTNKIIMVLCGSTSPDGSLALCESCEAALMKKYPQGWREVPGDICKHGNYVGSWSGPDYMCGYCENGE